MSAKYRKANDDEFKHEIKAKPNKFQKAGRFFYNKNTGRVCGRTCKSWGLLTIFFLCFYIVLSGGFLIMIYVFLNTVIPVHTPYRTGENSLLEFVPGINVNPRSGSGSGSIMGSQNRTGKLHPEYMAAVNIFFNKTFRDNEFMPDGVNCSNGATPQNVSQFCLFNRSLLGPCANPEKELSLGRICIYLRINKIYGWLPNVENKMLSNDTFVYCEGQNPGDVSSLGTPVYYPSVDTNNATRYGVISNRYFPFINQKNYSSPVVAVQFPEMTTNLAILIQCSLRNLKKVSKPVKFELFMSHTL